MDVFVLKIEFRYNKLTALRIGLSTCFLTKGTIDDQSLQYLNNFMNRKEIE